MKYLYLKTWPMFVNIPLSVWILIHMLSIPLDCPFQEQPYLYIRTNIFWDKFRTINTCGFINLLTIVNPLKHSIDSIITSHLPSSNVILFPATLTVSQFQDPTTRKPLLTAFSEGFVIKEVFPILQGLLLIAFLITVYRWFLNAIVCAFFSYFLRRKIFENYIFSGFYSSHFQTQSPIQCRYLVSVFIY